MKIQRIKSAQSLQVVRHREITAPGPYLPPNHPIPAVEIQGQTMSKELMEDLHKI